MVAIAQLFTNEIAGFFVSYDPALQALSAHALSIYMIFLLFAGVNTLGSALFTALNNGPVSSLIALSRTVIFEAGSVMLLPYLLGIEGIWWSVVVGEFIATCLTVFLLLYYRKRYKY